ncbi:unnamed protein product [Linum trigynum]
MLDSFSKDVGLTPNRSHNVQIKKLRELVILAEGPTPPVDMVVKQFLLLATGSLLVPTFARMCKLDFAPYIGGSVEDVRWRETGGQWRAGWITSSSSFSLVFSACFSTTSSLFFS